MAEKIFSRKSLDSADYYDMLRASPREK